MNEAMKTRVTKAIAKVLDVKPNNIALMESRNGITSDVEIFTVCVWYKGFKIDYDITMLIDGNKVHVLECGLNVLPNSIAVQNNA